MGDTIRLNEDVFNSIIGQYLTGNSLKFFPAEFATDEVLPGPLHPLHLEAHVCYPLEGGGLHGVHYPWFLDYLNGVVLWPLTPLEAGIVGKVLHDGIGQEFRTYLF